jgi:hypothetical protein
MSIKTTIGIDYSMTSPAICIHTGDSWSIDNCEFHYITDKKRLSLDIEQFHSSPPPVFSCRYERYEMLTDWVIESINLDNLEDVSIAIEGYSFGSKGLVYQIGGNGEFLRWYLWTLGHEISEYAPSALKKFAADHGQASKVMMYEAFFQDTNLDLESVLSCKSKNNPLSDVVDSYFVCKYHFQNMEPIEA